MQIDRDTYQESFNEPNEHAEERDIKRDVVVLNDIRFTRYTLYPDGRWTGADEAADETEWRLLPHKGLQLTGRMHCVLQNGSEFESGPNDLLTLPDGVDTWVVGTEPVIFIDVEHLGESDVCIEPAMPGEATMQGYHGTDGGPAEKVIDVTEEPGPVPVLEKVKAGSRRGSQSRIDLAPKG